MPARRSALILVCSLVACSDEIVGPTLGEFEQLCGENEPIRLLPIDPERVPDRVRSSTVGDHYMLTLRFGTDDATDVHEIWTVGRCGEQPIHLYDVADASASIRFEARPDLAFMCDADNERILAFDPTGARPSNEVFAARECSWRTTTAGIVTILGEGDTGPLVLQRWPDDPLAQTAEQVVLIDEVVARVASSTNPKPLSSDVLHVTESEVFALTTAGELTVVSLDSLESVVLAQDIRQFEVGPSGRYLVWQSTTITNDDPDWPEGPVFLLDRQSGEVTQFDETALDHTPNGMLAFEALGLLSYRAGALNDPTTGRWLRLDTLEPYPMPKLLWWRWLIDDNRAAVGRLDFEPPLWIIDIPTGDVTMLYDGPAHSMVPHEDGVWVLQEIGGPLLDVHHDGTTRTLARSTWLGWELLGGDRVLTASAVDARGLGDLVIVDPDTLGEALIDRNVQSLSATVPDAATGQSGELVAYMIVDSDPDRHGIWLAKPAKK